MQLTALLGAKLFRGLSVLLVVAALVGGTDALVRAHGGDTSQIHSCSHPTEFPLPYVVPASFDCTTIGPGWINLDWNIQGPPGPQGPAGPAGMSGYQVLASAQSCPANSYCFRVMNCPIGKSSIDSGLVTPYTDGPIFGLTLVEVSTNGTQGAIGLINRNATTATWTQNLTCASVQTAIAAAANEPFQERTVPIP